MQRFVHRAVSRRVQTLAYGRRAASSAAPTSDVTAGAKPGSLWVWGKIEENRMGLSVAHQNFGPKAFALGPAIGPTHNPHIHDVTQVVCAASKSLALTSDGSVYTWGTCKNFSLGHGDGVEKAVRPRKVEALSGIRIVQVAAGETISAAVSDEGEVYTWGWGGSFWEGNGGLGHGDNLTQSRPALVAALSDAGEFVTQVAVGSRHMFSLSREGRVFSWGNGEYGRCGNGKKKQLLPEPVALLEDKRVVQVASGHQHGLAVTDEGGVWVWGKNDAGQLGVGGSVLMDLNTMEEFPLLLEVEAERRHEWDGQVAAVAAGGNHSLALMRDGRVFQWGQRTFLQPQAVEFGYLKPADDGEAEETGTKRGKEGSIPLRAVQVAAGEGVSGVVDKHGHLYTWGKNLNTGMLGHSIYGVGSRLPARVDALHGMPLACVSFGSKHAAAIIGSAPGKR